MKKTLKAIGILGAGLVFVFWTHCAYKAGHDDCEQYMTNLKLHEELLRENTKLREELGI